MSIDADFGCGRLVLAAAVAMSLVLWPTVSRAETDPRLQLVTAVAAKEKALDSGRVQDWERTLELFQQLHAEHASAATAYEIGVAAGQLARDDIAFEAKMPLNLVCQGRHW